MSEQALDPTIFAEMRELMEDALAEFINTYLDNSPKLIQKIGEGLQTNNAELVFHNAHQLKGGSGSIGALDLAKLSLSIEQIGKSGSIEGVADLLDELKVEFSRVEDELKAEL
jgi:HPt (histidine-containing phosphotransfer) domain-containing protein